MSEGKVVVRSANIHRARPIKWAWSGRVVKDNLNLVVGNEGVGKGTLVAWILAMLTQGKLAGNLWDSPCNVAVIGDEDDFDSVWTPRIVGACGGNEKRVKQILRDDFDQVDIRRDISRLAEIVQKQKIQLLYFDQFLDNLATETDHYHAKQVRAAVAPLRSIAKTLGVTTIATMHPNKRAETFRQLVQGTSAFNAMARSSLYLAEHPEKQDVRVLVTAKSNYYRTGEALEFKIAEWTDRPNGYLLKQSKATSFRKSEVTLEELIASGKTPRRTSKESQVEKLVRSILVDREWHESSEVYDACEQQGYSQRMVRKAKEKLGVESQRSKFQGKVEWRYVVE